MNIFQLQSIFQEQIKKDISGNKKGGLRCVIVGNDESRSALLNDITFVVKDLIPFADVFSGSIRIFNEFQAIFPSKFICTDVNKNIQNILNQQKNSSLKNPWALHIIDEYIDPTFYNNSEFKEIYKHIRHSSTLNILSMEQLISFNPCIRVNMDYIFIFNDPRLKVRKMLYKNLAYSIDSFRTFCNLLDNIRNNYTALVINNRLLTDNIFYYTASIHPDVKFGSEEDWTTKILTTKI